MTYVFGYTIYPVAHLPGGWGVTSYLYFFGVADVIARVNLANVADAQPQGDPDDHVDQGFSLQVYKREAIFPIFVGV